MNLHKEIDFCFNGSRPALKLCALSPMNIDPPRLFVNLTEDIKPIATRSRKYSSADLVFIKSEVSKLQQDGIIEISNSPWRAQALVVHGSKKQRMVIDYSNTINRFTLLDAFPLPDIELTVQEISQYSKYSRID